MVNNTYDHILWSFFGFTFLLSVVHSFQLSTTAQFRSLSFTKQTTQLAVSIGLGPPSSESSFINDGSNLRSFDYDNIPDHEAYRTSRRSAIDERCDAWFEALLGPSLSSTETTTTSDLPFLQHLADQARQRLVTPVELKNEVLLPEDDPNFTAYVNERLPWQPLLPAYGLEQFGLPIPRRNADTWRHFDVPGMISQDYSRNPEAEPFQLNDDEVVQYREKLIEKGGWLDDDAVTARLIYINGRFCPQLSITTDTIRTMVPQDLEDEEISSCLSRITDGFTDALAAPVPSGPTDFLTSFSKLSAPDHNMGDATSQFAINTQQGTACFTALNTIKTNAVALIRIPSSDAQESDSEIIKPVMLVNAITKDMGVHSGEEEKGVSCHPRALVIAEPHSRLSLVQSCVDLDIGEYRPKLYNGFTQIFVKEHAQVTHTYLEETGGIVIGGTEVNDNEIPEGTLPPRVIESQRPSLRDTHLESLDVQITGDEGSYSSTMMTIGGSGRVRVALSVSLLRPGSQTTVNGFNLSGGAQRTDVKTNIHHIAQGTTSEQVQKTMIGGRATGAFRGRIRVEQSAQQTQSQQLSRTILLSDRCRAWAAPTLEIVADDVTCTHGATVSDLSEEELFYLRSRGLDPTIARNLLMYAFVGDIASAIEPALRGEVDSPYGLTRRVLQRLENLVPRGERKVKGQFQSV